MIEIKVGEAKKISLEHQKDQITLNGTSFGGEIKKINEKTFKVFRDNRIFEVEIVNQDGKQISLKVNNQLVDVSVTDHIDQILDRLGMNMVAGNVVTDVKAPMPGSILAIVVSEGDEVNEGDQLLVLEAMKMENVIKSTGQGTVRKIHITEKESVEKNQVLISFE